MHPVIYSLFGPVIKALSAFLSNPPVASGSFPTAKRAASTKESAERKLGKISLMTSFVGSAIAA